MKIAGFKEFRGSPPAFYMKIAGSKEFRGSPPDFYMKITGSKEFRESPPDFSVKIQELTKSLEPYGLLMKSMFPIWITDEEYVP